MYTELSDLDVINPELQFELTIKDEEHDRGLFIHLLTNHPNRDSVIFP